LFLNAPATPTTSSPYENCPNRNPAQVKFSSACGLPVRQINEEIAVIEAGLERLVIAAKAA
jgi:hypothetical protein